TLTGNKKYTGTANCATCNKPTAASAGTPSVAECATCNAGFDLDTGKNCVSNGNTNKGGLSTGAIAGISVAAVVVVGGLVGFLCWWFVCRGKA
ncbi:Variant-specific surface protein, partial [Giardia duodenalis]